MPRSSTHRPNGGSGGERATGDERQEEERRGETRDEESRERERRPEKLRWSRTGGDDERGEI
jgi:hypothetical protein